MVTLSFRSGHICSHVHRSSYRLSAKSFVGRLSSDEISNLDVKKSDHRKYKKNTNYVNYRE